MMIDAKRSPVTDLLHIAKQLCISHVNAYDVFFLKLLLSYSFTHIIKAVRYLIGTHSLCTLSKPLQRSAQRKAAAQRIAVRTCMH